MNYNPQINSVIVIYDFELMQVNKCDL